MATSPVLSKGYKQIRAASIVEAGQTGPLPRLNARGRPANEAGRQVQILNGLDRNGAQASTTHKVTGGMTQITFLNAGNVQR